MESYLFIDILFLSQSMMSNPDLIRQMIMGNPQMQQLIEVYENIFGDSVFSLSGDNG